MASRDGYLAARLTGVPWPPLRVDGRRPSRLSPASTAIETAPASAAAILVMKISGDASGRRQGSAGDTDVSIEGPPPLIVTIEARSAQKLTADAKRSRKLKALFAPIKRPSRESTS